MYVTGSRRWRGARSSWPETVFEDSDDGEASGPGASIALSRGADDPVWGRLLRRIAKQSAQMHDVRAHLEHLRFYGSTENFGKACGDRTNWKARHVAGADLPTTNIKAVPPAKPCGPACEV